MTWFSALFNAFPITKYQFCSNFFVISFALRTENQVVKKYVRETNMVTIAWQIVPCVTKTMSRVTRILPRTGSLLFHWFRCVWSFFSSKKETKTTSEKFVIKPERKIWQNVTLIKSSNVAFKVKFYFTHWNHRLINLCVNIKLNFSKQNSSKIIVFRVVERWLGQSCICWLSIDRIIFRSRNIFE